jgi:hypothetical protein
VGRAEPVQELLAMARLLDRRVDRLVRDAELRRLERDPLVDLSAQQPRLVAQRGHGEERQRPRRMDAPARLTRKAPGTLPEQARARIEEAMREPARRAAEIERIERKSVAALARLIVESHPGVAFRFGARIADLLVRRIVSDLSDGFDRLSLFEPVNPEIGRHLRLQCGAVFVVETTLIEVAAMGPPRGERLQHRATLSPARLPSMRSARPSRSLRRAARR